MRRKLKEQLQQLVHGHVGNLKQVNNAIPALTIAKHIKSHSLYLSGNLSGKSSQLILVFSTAASLRRFISSFIQWRM